MLVLPLLMGAADVPEPDRLELHGLSPLGWTLLAAGMGLLLLRQLTRPRWPATQADSLPTLQQPRAVMPRPDEWSEQALDALDSDGFEAMVQRLLQQGPQRVHVRSRGEGGLWLQLFASSSPGRASALALCRHGDGKPIKLAEVRELAQAMAAQNVDGGRFITASRFTEEAQRFAQTHGIEMLDRDALLAMIASRTRVQQQELLALACTGWGNL